MTVGSCCIGFVYFIYLSHIETHFTSLEMPNYMDKYPVMNLTDMMFLPSLELSGDKIPENLDEYLQINLAIGSKNGSKMSY